MGLTSDRNDPRLGHGVDSESIPQHEVYLVLSEEELAKGFVRPVRKTYIHVGVPGPKYPLRDLTDDEHARYDMYGYVKFEEYPKDSLALGRFWTQENLDNTYKGCGGSTTMNQVIAETYAREPGFYGATYCVHCQKHLPVGEYGEFIWEDSTQVGT
jgi:hypothetical protein